MNNTLRYGFDIMELLAERGRDCSTTELADELNLSKSQVSRILKTLTEIGYLSRNPSSRHYAINLSVLKLSHNCLANMKQLHIIRPYMQQLVDEFNKPSFSSVPIGLEAIVCDVVYPRDIASSSTIISQLGAVNDPYATASGKIAAAYLTTKEFDKLFSTRAPIKYTEQTILERSSIIAEHQVIREENVAISCSERGEGRNAVAAPIFNTHKEFIATIGLALPKGDLSEAEWSEYKNKIITTGHAISCALGYPLS